jgi:hypothetical protein
MPQLATIKPVPTPNLWPTRGHFMSDMRSPEPTNEPENETPRAATTAKQHPSNTPLAQKPKLHFITLWSGTALLVPLSGYCAARLFGLMSSPPPLWLSFPSVSVRFNSGVFCYLSLLLMFLVYLKCGRNVSTPEESAFERDKKRFRDVPPGELLWKAFRRRELQADDIKRQNFIYLLLGLLTSVGVVFVWFVVQKVPLTGTSSSEKFAGMFSRLLIVSFLTSLASASTRRSNNPPRVSLSSGAISAAAPNKDSFSNLPASITRL